MKTVNKSRQRCRWRVFVLIAGATLLGAMHAHAQPIASAIGLPYNATHNASTAPNKPFNPAWYQVCSDHSNTTPSAPGRDSAPQLKSCNATNPNHCLSRVTIPLKTFPDAMFNDGSPAVFYVRRGQRDDIHKWVIHLQGGGRCDSYDACLQRWCGHGQYKANKMSSDWDGDKQINLPEIADVEGMSKYSDSNPFRHWNHVWMYYGSSDNWMGRANDVLYKGTHSFTMHNRGHSILVAARKMLRKQTARNWRVDNQDLTLPDLDQATHVVFTGTSAGAAGALMNADWFLKPLSAQYKYLILDGNLDNLDTVLTSQDIWVDQDGDNQGDMPYHEWRIQDGIESWATGYHAAINAFTDTSCRNYYEPRNRMDRCSYFSTLLGQIKGQPIIETPTFIRFDLEDSVASKPWQGKWPDDTTQLLVRQHGQATTLKDHLPAIRETLVMLYKEQSPVTGVFGPRCGKHVGLEDEAAYRLHKTYDVDLSTSPPTKIANSQHTAEQAIVEWLQIGAGTGPQPLRILDGYHVDTPKTKASTCQ